jgi:2-oxoglutarate ferredoxin oxidoreductase subunit delta
MSKQHLATEHIQLYRKNCKACWKCVENCPQKVFGKINIIFHKHSRINNPEECNGCLKCLKFCEHDAISKVKN